jgi:hypothetical protein
MGDVWAIQTLKLGVSALLIGMVWVPHVTYAAGVLVLGQALAHSLQLQQLRRRGVVSVNLVGRAYGRHFVLAALPALALWLVTASVAGLVPQLVAAVITAGGVSVVVLLLGNRIDGIAALSRRGLLPARLAARLRGVAG